MSRETARYTRDGSSRAAGCVVYDDDTKIQVYSDTAPTRGQLNAFDLVRIEKYGSLDKDVPAGTPMAQLPSYIKMCELARQQPELRPKPDEELIEPANDDAWLDTGVPTVASEPKRKRFQPISAREFMTTKPAEWIVDGILPQAELAFVLGKPGSGKTFFSLDMACAITRGIDWCGRKVKKGRVVYVVLEGTRGFAGRVRSYVEAKGVDPAELPDIITDAPNLLEPGDAKELAESIGKADVIYVDTLSCSHGGDENSGLDMGRVLRAAKHLHKATGAVIVFLHHPPHEGDRIRGHSSMTGAADAIITINKQGEGSTAVRSAATSKLKDGIEGPLFNFRITDRGLFEPTGGDVAARALRLPPQGTLMRTALDVVKALIAKQGGPVAVAAAREAIVETKTEPEPGKTDRRGSRATEEIDKLKRQGLLFVIAGKLSDTQLVKGSDAGF